MTQNVNFKSLEVTGATKEEALASAPFNVNLPGADCTAALRLAKKAHTGAWTSADQKAFELAQLEKKTRNTPGNGCYIVVESAVVDTRERPYRVNDFKKKGVNKWKTVINIYENVGTEAKPVAGTLLLSAAGDTKAEAKENAKKLYTEKGITVNTVARYSKEIVDGEPIAFTVTYTPSKGSRHGVYKVFGVEA